MKRRLLFLTCLGSLVGAASAWADHPVELGQTDPRPAVSCPENCNAVGQVTGFMVQQGTKMHPYQPRRRGKVVAFSVTLGDPKPSDIDFFKKLFGGRSQAQLSVLRPGTRQRYRVTGVSEAFDLEPYFGSTPTFALSRPLTVKPGYAVALTIPTWAPAFAVGLGADEAWRGSRDPKRCDDVQQQAAQTTRGQLASYSCLFHNARLMYTVTFIPAPKVTKPGALPQK